jgi:protein involved in polysaccharide export with SLBB domain
MRLPTAVATLLLLVAPALHAQAQPAPQATVSAASPGDLIRLVVWRSPEFSGEFPIGPDGTILHPLLSDVHVAGVPPEVVRARIAEVLRHFESDPRFVYSVLYRISVTGEVSEPGLYPLPAETTIPQALAAAGGPSPNAQAGRVFLIRGGQRVLIDLRNGDGAAEMRIQPGDRLEVPRHGNLLREVIVPFSSVVGAIGAVITVARH